MKLRSSILLAFRFLFPHSESEISNARKSLVGAVICVALSLIPLVVVSVVTNGMIQGITARIIGLSSYDLQVVHFSGKNNETELVSKIQTDYAVTGVYIEHQGLALAAGKTARSGVTVRAVQNNIFTQNQSFASLFSVQSGILGFNGANSVLIGKKLAETIGVSAGDTMRLITLRTRENGSVIPRVSSFKVSGVISCGYQELDALWVFMPLETSASFLGEENVRQIIGIQTKNPFSKTLDYTAKSIESMLPKGYGVYTWKELNTAQYQNFESTRVMLLFIMFLIVLTACANVSSALVMLVMERRKEIAVLKSFGATPQGISAAFVAAGTFTGFLGVLFGIPLGLLCAININKIIFFIEKIINFFYKILYTVFSGSEESMSFHLLDPAYYLETVPIIIPVFETVFIAVGAILLSALVSLIPAIRSGKEKPLTILRKY